MPVVSQDSATFSAKAISGIRKYLEKFLPPSHCFTGCGLALRRLAISDWLSLESAVFFEDDLKNQSNENSSDDNKGIEILN